VILSFALIICPRVSHRSWGPHETMLVYAVIILFVKIYLWQIIRWCVHSHPVTTRCSSAAQSPGLYGEGSSPWQRRTLAFKMRGEDSGRGHLVSDLPVKEPRFTFFPPPGTSGCRSADQTVPRRDREEMSGGRIPAIAGRMPQF
jgi:hypothetical protein